MFTQQHYYAVAKRFRENFPLDLMPDTPQYAHAKHDLLVRRNMLIQLVIEFTKYFEKDNEKFNPLLFLEHCSPDNDRYPLTELWEVEEVVETN